MPDHIAYVEGIGIWSDQLPGWELARKILRDECPAPAPSQKRPAPSLLPANERRRAPDTVAISLEVASKACEHAGRDPAQLPSVFASTHGDLAVTDYMCATLAQSPELISPTKFHNSVHNAAAGYWAIATGCTLPYTAISASHFSFGNGLLESLVQLHGSDTGVLFVAYDIEACGALATTVQSEGRLGLALVLNPDLSARARFSLQWQVRGAHPAADAAATGHEALVAGNAMASGLKLFEVLARRGGDASYAIAPRLALDLHVEMIGAGDAE